MEEHAALPRVLHKLRALKPGNPQSALPTRSTSKHEQHQTHQQQKTESDSERLTKIEDILVSLTKYTAPTKQECFRFKRGKCERGDKCRFEHVHANGSSNSNSSNTSKYCALHKSTTHNTSECIILKNNPALKEAFGRLTDNKHGQVVNKTTTEEDDGYSFLFPTRVSLPKHIFAMQDKPKIDLWCVDGAATTFATYDRNKCFNIRPCKVTIHGPNSKDSFTCKEMGDARINVLDETTGKSTQLTVTNVLISEAFPFHIFSEILAFEKNCTAIKSLGSWQFLNPSKKPLFHASQRLLNSSSGHSDVKLYFIDEAPQANTAAIHATTLRPMDSLPTTPDEKQAQSLSTAKPTAKISTAKNLQMLLELHCAHAHWNFEDVATHYGLTLPCPRPSCWACLLSKPKLITHDKISTRKVSRVFEGFAADAKGPMKTPTPEGYTYYFLIVGLFSHYYWVKLVKSQTEWKAIWPAFVKRAEAKSGKDRCVAFIITDGHKVHSDGAILAFNEDRGIETITCAPYSQWQDPAERGIQTVQNGARTSLIHGGGKEWMWGWAVEHSADSANRMPPPRPVPGHEGKSRLRIAFPAMTREKEMRTLKPFLCLAFRTVPKAQRASNFNPRANACVHLRWVPEKKAYALLTIPNLYLVYSIEVRFVTQSFPLRVTNHLMNQLDTFLRPTIEDTLYASIHGPGNVMQRRRLANSAVDPTTIVTHAPIQVHQPPRQPVAAEALPGPGWSTTRGYHPTVAGLESAAYVAAIPATSSEKGQFYTPDQLAARTPRCIQHALRGPDAKYWLPAVLKDFAIIRDNHCIINVTDKPPPGPAPPSVEQRFKIKYRGEEPIQLEEISPEDWKARTLARGDRFRHGEHYDATSSPVVHTPVLKIILAWAVANGYLVFQWDQGHAFYGNQMDRSGIIVRCPAGYDPDSPALRPLHLPPLYGELAAALPGIPQGSLLHYKELSSAIQEQGFKPLDADNCLFLHNTIDMATTLHVDDGVLAAPSLEHAEKFLGSSGLGRKKKITWGPLSNTLGIDFKVVYSAEQRMIFMSQRSYAVTILERANMRDCNPARTPASPGRKYTKTDCATTDEQKAELRARGVAIDVYHPVVASLNFLVSITRDDMRFIHGKLAKYCANPGEEHMKALKHALRFLKGTLDHGIEFIWRASDPPPQDGSLDMVAWSDSSFADDVDTGRSTLGVVIKVNGATVSTTSKLSPRVDSCVNHSELNAFAEVSAPSTKPSQPRDCDQLTDGASVALVKASRTVTWLRGIKAALERREIADMPPTPILVDNAGVISMLADETLKSANRHIYRALAENRERVHLDKSVVAVKISTEHNLANALTKQEHGITASVAQLRLITGPTSG